MSRFTPTLPIILGIDTSCDDTSAAVVAGQQVWSNVIASQTQLHQPYGGVFPTVAKQAHQANIAPTIAVALKRAGATWSQITAIAVTVGPGLAPALEVGITTVKELAAKHHKPVIAINHMEAHALSAWVLPRSRTQPMPNFPPALPWPALAITVSGGHTEFVRLSAYGEYQLLGQTIDDAAGECLDKVGRMLNLGYPAGPIVEEFAKLGNATAIRFPLPMATTDSGDMSFSGLKTAARNHLTTHPVAEMSRSELYDFAASFQHAVFMHICYKLRKVLARTQATQPVTTVLLGGGVAANQTLRRYLRATLKPFGLRLQVPYTRKLCSDNGAMIGWCGALAYQHQLQTSTDTLERQPRLKIGGTGLVTVPVNH